MVMENHSTERENNFIAANPLHQGGLESGADQHYL
jgi:hypothetical protein